MEMKTIFSPCRKWRYQLWRQFETSFLFDGGNRMKDGYLMVVGLNPSTADETKDDPTIRKCIGFAKRWGYGALCMTNLFAWRDTQPENMKKQPFPEGIENDHHILQCASAAGMVLAAWGKHGSYRQRDISVADKLHNIGVTLHCLKHNADNSPMHPLYVPYETKPVVWSPA